MKLEGTRHRALRPGCPTSVTPTPPARGAHARRALCSAAPAYVLFAALAASAVGCYEADGASPHSAGPSGSAAGGPGGWAMAAGPMLHDEQPGSVVDWSQPLGAAQLSATPSGSELHAPDSGLRRAVFDRASLVDMRVLDPSDPSRDAAVLFDRRGEAFWADRDLFFMAYVPTPRVVIGTVWGTDDTGREGIIALMGGTVMLMPGEAVQLASLDVYAVFLSWISTDTPYYF